MYFIPPQLENELVLLGILPKTEIEALEEIIDPRKKCMQKGYYRDPYDENGEILF